MAIPKRILPLPAHGEIVADPQVAFAVEHRLAARAIAATVEFEGEYPCTRREIQIRHVWHRPQILALRERVELAEQRKESFGLVPGIAGNRLRCRQRVRGRIALWWRGGGEQLCARIS